jgi:hypothetical protein
MNFTDEEMKLILGALIFSACTDCVIPEVESTQEDAVKLIEKLYEAGKFPCDPRYRIYRSNVYEETFTKEFLDRGIIQIEE